MLAKTNGWAVPLQWLARKHAGHHARIESIGLGCLARQWLLGIMLAQALWAVCLSQSHGTLVLQCSKHTNEPVHTSPDNLSEFPIE